MNEGPRQTHTVAAVPHNHMPPKELLQLPTGACRLTTAQSIKQKLSRGSSRVIRGSCSCMPCNPAMMAGWIAGASYVEMLPILRRRLQDMMGVSGIRYQHCG